MANKKRRCKYCREYHQQDKMLSNALGFYCCKDHMIEDAVKSKEKLSQKGFNKRQRDAKQRLKTRREWLSGAQSAFNRYIRVRDYGKPCISCGTRMDWNSYGGKVDAGHYRSTGGCSGARFNVFNVFAQCVKCNRYLSGNAAEYRLALVERFGVDRVEAVESIPKSKTYSIDYLKRIKAIYTKKARLYERRFRSVN